MLVERLGVAAAAAILVVDHFDIKLHEKCLRTGIVAVDDRQVRKGHHHVGQPAVHPHID